MNKVYGVDEMPEFKTLKALAECSNGAQEIAALQEQKEQQFNNLIASIPKAIENAVMAVGLGGGYGTA